MPFTQLLLNAGSLKVEHWHTLISYPPSNNPREILTHTDSNQWGITNPSPRLSVCRPGRQHSGQGSCQHLARNDLQSWVQQGRQSAQSSRAEPLAADDKGDQCGMEQHPGVWSSAVSAVAWNWPCYTLKVVYPTLLGLFNKCIGTPDGKCGIHPGAYLWVTPRVSSADTTTLTIRAVILSVSPCQMCLFWLR